MMLSPALKTVTWNFVVEWSRQQFRPAILHMKSFRLFTCFVQTECLYWAAKLRLFFIVATETFCVVFCFARQAKSSTGSSDGTKVQLTNITLDQSKHWYGNITPLHVYPLKSLYPMKSFGLYDQHHVFIFQYALIHQSDARIGGWYKKL